MLITIHAFQWDVGGLDTNDCFVKRYLGSTPVVYL